MRNTDHDPPFLSLGITDLSTLADYARPVLAGKRGRVRLPSTGPSCLICLWVGLGAR